MKITDYEKNQNFNWLVKELHKVRYRHLISAVREEFEDRPFTVLDIGCAHATAFKALNAEFSITYHGVDHNESYIEFARQRYGEASNFSATVADANSGDMDYSKFDLVIALETLEHIPMVDCFRLVSRIGQSPPRLFLCSVPNEVGPILWIKNVGSMLLGYMRHREYSWNETLNAGLYRLERVGRHGTDHKGFDWRWLAHTIRQNFHVAEINSSPFSWLPKTLSFSVFWKCRPATFKAG
jgi:ubiquinone/menaquinone biosynthesis C-methylase UbiE